MAESGYYDQYQGAAADEGEQYAEDEEYYEEYEEGKPKKGNILPIWVSNEKWPRNVCLPVCFTRHHYLIFREISNL